MANKANRIIDVMDCINKGITSREKIPIISLSLLTGHTCNTGCSVFSFGPWHAKNTQNHGQAGKAPEKGHRDNQRSGKPDIWEKAKNWVDSALKKEGLREPLSPYSNVQRVATKKSLPFYKQSRGKDEGSCVQITLWYSSWILEECHWNKIHKESIGLPSIGHFKDLAGQGAGLPCLDHAIARKGWTRPWLRSPPTWYFIILWSYW